MEHAFDIGYESSVVFSESQEHPNKTVGVIRTMQKVLVEGGSLTLCGCVKYNAYLARLIRIHDSKVR